MFYILVPYQQKNSRISLQDTLKLMRDGYLSRIRQPFSLCIKGPSHDVPIVPIKYRRKAEVGCIVRIRFRSRRGNM
jgi:hypothetical protein